LLLLAALHFAIPKELGWKDDLAKLSAINRQIFQVHVSFIVLILILFGCLTIFFAPDLVAPRGSPKRCSAASHSSGR
jgi:UDP-N-acetylmuramyl pentapeptide phosphotransferase/UDP-N-acetylglucosamine-1-phosphate transferase